MNLNILKTCPLNTEVEVDFGRFKAFSIGYNPTKKEYTWTLFFPRGEELQKVRPLRITGQTKTWKNKSEALSSLKKHIKEYKDG